MGNMGVQMDGWYRKEIRTTGDLQGVRMMTAGFAGMVLSRLGVVPQQMAAGEAAAALEQDALDAVSRPPAPAMTRRSACTGSPGIYYPG